MILRSASQLTPIKRKLQTNGFEHKFKVQWLMALSSDVLKIEMIKWREMMTIALIRLKNGCNYLFFFRKKWMFFKDEFSFLILSSFSLAPRLTLLEGILRRLVKHNTFQQTSYQRLSIKLFDLFQTLTFSREHQTRFSSSSIIH